ncbi:MAG: hypothetical protein F4Y08_13055 [Caldilineaceae bacterium SB0662_bin_9]|uniref:Transposase family protein n=1 Tax=Caldilineaceae bacterium SB0662_bin_9 TaxID=2605258 RepID=A0A6B1DX03_9CHLR|nr:hypothetical protein [Caldilineaceae bacterium SB0662_bin_9]
MNATDAPALLMALATVTAIHHNPAIRAFYTRPCVKGKPRKVALVAAMCTLFTVLNAVSRDQVPWQTEPLSTALHV